jgi:hypothetical protein
VVTAGLAAAVVEIEPTVARPADGVPRITAHRRLDRGLKRPLKFTRKDLNAY